MLILKDVSKSYDDKQILNKISFTLGKNEIVGLVGENGVGKSTLLKLITGETNLDEGNIYTQDDSIGYLPQDPDFKEQTVEEFLISKLRNEEDQYKIDIALEKVELEPDINTQLCKTLSGGQKTKLYLAALLLADPKTTILLLDEPTNNLDIKALEWLEDFIINFNGSVLLTSHDRHFLDRTVDKIIEIEDADLHVYGGGYTAYRENKLKEKEAYLKKYEENTLEIKRLEKTIIEKRERVQQLTKQDRRDNDKFAANFFRERVTKKVSQSKSNTEAQLERLQRIEKPDKRKNYIFGFDGEVSTGKLLVSAVDINKKFDSKSILKDISFEVRGNERIWLSGTNGSGKTTLLNIISGNMESDSGIINWGKDVKFGYFSQSSSHLDLENNGITELLSTGATPTECYQSASYIHITEEDLNKPMKDLSRGQVTKIAFIKLLLGNNHLLILDEPTNHLEIETREEIENALKDYKGGILVSSHDRYFLEEIDITREVCLDRGVQD